MASEGDFYTHLRQVFELCDEGQRGYLDSNQLRELGLKHLGGREEDMVQLLRCLDPDGQGSISFHDFCKGVVNLMNHQGSLQTAEEEETDKYLSETAPSSPGSLSNNLINIDSPISSNHSSLINVDNGPESIMSADVQGANRRSSNNNLSSSLADTTDKERRNNTIQRLNGVNEQLNASSKRISPGYPSDSEERFECYGEGDDLEEVDDGVDLPDGLGASFPSTPTHHHPNSPNNHNHTDLLNGFGAKPSLSSDSFRSNSSVGSTGSGGRNSSSARTTPFQQRNTWLRSSLRRQSGSSKRVSSNALASQLFRNGSGTPNGGHQSLSNNNNGGSNSRRSSLSCDSDEMYTDQISLEDDVIDLNQKVLELQHQVSTLSENQCNNDDRYSKVKQENQALMARIHSLEEQIRELEIRSEERVQEEERRLKESMARHEREKNQELEHFTNRLYALQQEHLEVKEELIRIKGQSERLRIEKIQIENELSDCKAELNAVQDLARREREEFTQERNNNAQVFNELSRELDELRRYRRDNEEAAALATARSRSPSGLVDLPSRCQELEREVRQLREESAALREANEELQAQLLNTSLAEGRQLLNPAAGKSLAQEFENLTRDQAVDALREQQDDNAKLRAYIDNILLNIVENYPQLLEVKSTE